MTGRTPGWPEPSHREVSAEVKWYSASKGFGFVQLSDGSPDAFLHVSVVEQTGRHDLPDGTKIVCDIAEGRKGRQVSYIHRIESLGTGPSRGASRGGFGDRDRGGYGDRDRGGYGGGGGGYGGGGGGYGGGDRGGYGDRDRGGGGGYGGGGDRGGYSGGGGAGGGAGGPGTQVDGTVKFFDAAKGYGFVTPDDGSKDVFVSARTLGRTGIAALENNQRVRLLVRMGQKGPMADSVELIDQG